MLFIIILPLIHKRVIKSLVLTANNIEGRVPESVQDAQLDVEGGGRRNVDERGESDEEQEQVSPRQADGRFRVVREPDRSQDLQRRLLLFLSLLVNIQVINYFAGNHADGMGESALCDRGILRQVGDCHGR